jgi:hypothetical protein
LVRQPIDPSASEARRNAARVWDGNQNKQKQRMAGRIIELRCRGKEPDPQLARDLCSLPVDLFPDCVAIRQEVQRPSIRSSAAWR